MHGQKNLCLQWWEWTCYLTRLFNWISKASSDREIHEPIMTDDATKTNRPQHAQHYNSKQPASNLRISRHPIKQAEAGTIFPRTRNNTRNIPHSSHPKTIQNISNEAFEPSKTQQNWISSKSTNAKTKIGSYFPFSTTAGPTTPAARRITHPGANIICWTILE